MYTSEIVRLKPLFFKTEAFSLVELLTSVSVIGVLSVIGIKSYQSQTNKARTAEAKQSLSYLYTSQRSFYNNWNSYHENLIAVGASPSGQYNYDVGFSKTATMSATDGDLENYPLVDGTQILNNIECSNFNQICNDECFTQIRSSVSTAYRSYFSGRASCTVNVPNSLLLKTKAQTGAEADATSFKAIAVGELKNEDVWSINQQQAVSHETDGTQ